MNFLRLLDQLVIPFLLIFIFIGSLGGIALGGALLLRAAAAIGFIRNMNRWVSTRQATRSVEIQREAFHRSRMLGIFLVGGSLIACYFLVIRLQIPRSALAVADPKFVMALAVESARWILVIGCLVSFVIGVLVLFFPRVLDALEARMNRWISTRHLLPPGGDQMRAPLDILVEAYPRAAGWVIAGASLAVAIAMGVLISIRWLR